MTFRRHLAEHRIALLLLLLFFTLITGTVMLQSKDLKSIPTCLYGCDYYYETGIAMDLENNPSHFWQSSSHDYLGIANTLPKMYFYIRLAFTKILDYEYFNSWKAVFPMTVFFILLGLLGWYWFFSKIFKEKTLNAALAILSMSTSYIPYFKYRNIFFPILPFFLILMIELYRENSLKKDIILSIAATLMLVLISNIHAMSFFIAYAILATAYWMMSMNRYHPKSIIKSLKDRIILRKTIITACIGLISFVINLLLGWWYQAVFVMKGENYAFKYTIFTDLNIPSNYFLEILANIKSLLPFNDPVQATISILTLAGIMLYISLVISDKKNINPAVNWISAFILLSIFHYIITVPVLHRFLSTAHAITFTKILFQATYTGYLFNTLPKIKGLNASRLIPIASVLMILIFSYASFTTVNRFFDDKFVQSGKNPVPGHYQALIGWMKESKTSPDSMIILSTNELSFALHGLTGAKVLTGRQSHFFHFADFHRIWADAAIIFYGKDEENKYKVLSDYKKTADETGKELYLYWDNYWINSEWMQNGDNYLPYDPLRFEYSEEYAGILNENEISYWTAKDAIFEPAMQDNPKAQKMDIIYVDPTNYNNFTHPWHPNLEPYLEEIWSYEQQGTSIARLYKIII